MYLIIPTTLVVYLFCTATPTSPSNLFNCMHRRVTVVMCLSVTTLAATYLVYTSQVWFRRVLYGVFKVLVVWLSLKTLRSRVLASFADHRRLPRSSTTSRWTKETEMASFQHKECAISSDSSHSTTDSSLNRAN